MNAYSAEAGPNTSFFAVVLTGLPAVSFGKSALPLGKILY
jgi:hypothetical protein